VNDIGYISNIIENHDTARGVSKFLPDGGRTDAAKKMVGGLNFMLKGLPFIFQGQEIGMENTEFHSIDEVDDCSTFANYNLMLEKGYSEEEALDCVRKFSRDNARTPMQWSAEENAGFTTGEPWLKVNKNYSSINVEAQRKDPDSIFHFYRQLAALRKNDLYKETVVYGELVPYLEEQKNLMAYFRKADKTLLVLGNYQKEPQDVVLPGSVRKVLINNQKTWMCEEQILHMEGYQFLVLEM
ncbi:MAG: glucohydrolase, partial [Clostridiales bacterium]|nr:glucohydrolase [Candidatus Blautia equi]